MTTNYAERMNQVCGYIETHLEDELSVEELSRIANFSKYHFHRQFSEYFGITVLKFIRLMRLKRASYQLAFHLNESITTIGFDAQFENSESFSRAFKKIFGQTPSQFRKKPDWLNWHKKYQLPKQTRKPLMHIEIVEFKTTKIAVLEHRGSPKLLNDSIAQFIPGEKKQNYHL